MDSIENLVAGLNSFHTRSISRKKLSLLGPGKAGPSLLNQVKNPAMVDNAAWAVMEIFTEWKYEECLPTMIELLSSRDKLQSDIARSLAKITGIDLGNDPDAWNSFLEGPTVFSSIRASFDDSEVISFSLVDDYCKFILPPPNNRKQEIVVFEKNEKLTIYTECGYIHAEQIPAVEELGKKVEYAELVCESIEGRIKVTLTAEWNGNDTDYSLLKEQIKFFATFADDLENQLTGQDNI